MIGARFHRTIANLGIDICRQARSQTSLNEVVLSGGVWQNQILLNLVRSELKRNGFIVYSHHQVPTNDGGLALGQAVIANCTQGIQELTHKVTDRKVADNTL
jgi:hydrogenase maturation protein HypF